MDTPMRHRDNTDTTIHELLEHFASRQVDSACDFGEIVSLAYKDGRDRGFEDGMNQAFNLFIEWAEGLKQQDSAAQKRIAD